MNSTALFLLRPALACVKSARPDSLRCGPRILRQHLSNRWTHVTCRHSAVISPIPERSLKRASPSSTTTSHASHQTRCYSKRPSSAPRPIPEPTETPASQEALTWRDYDPEGGLPLARGELPASEISTIFGPATSADVGNWILRLVNYRRQSGSLIEHGVTFTATQNISPTAANAALDYLRAQMPEVDEVATGQDWAEEQAQILENGYLERAQRFKLYEKDEQRYDDDAEHLQDDSVLVTLRKQSEARRKQSEARQAADAAVKEQAEQDAVRARGFDSDKSHEASGSTTSSGGGSGSGTSTDVATSPVQKAWLQPVERKPWVKYYEQQAQIIKSDQVPDRSAFSRLWPSAAVSLATVGACMVVGATYSPPATEAARVFPGMMQGTATLVALVGGIFVLFCLHRLPPLWKPFNLYFKSIPGYPKAVSMVLSMFCHENFGHMVWNCAMLVAFGHFFHQEVGRGVFLATFVGTGAVAAWCSLAQRVYARRWFAYSFGASNAVYGVVAACCIVQSLRSDSEFKIGTASIPISAGALILGGLIAMETVIARAPLAKAAVASADHVGHFTGMASGAIAAWLITRNDREKKSKNGVSGSGSEGETGVQVRIP